MTRKLRHLFLGACLFSAPAFLPLLADGEGAPMPDTATAESRKAPDVSEDELITMVGFMTAQGGRIGSLELDGAQIATLADGLRAAVAEEAAPGDFPRKEIRAAFGEVQARAKAVQSGEEDLPSVSDDALRKLGIVMVMQSGLQQLGFGPEAADLVRKGFMKGAKAGGMTPEMEAKMPAFREFIRERAESAEAARKKQNAAVAEENIAEGEAFLESVSEEEGVESTDSGLYYKITEKGDGEKPTMEDSVLVHYKGTLVDGTQFDSSYDRGQPAEFPLNGVVPGFGEGLTKVAEGGAITLYIPSELGYGNNPRPGGPIEPGDTLIFECELIAVNPGSGDSSEDG